MIPPKLLKAYTHTVYRVHSENHVVSLQIGVTSDFLLQTMKRLRVTTACLITAWNPYSRLLQNTENRERNKLLSADIQIAGLFHLPAKAEDPNGEWPDEESFLVLGPSLSLAIEWCRKYQQNAVVWVNPHSVPTLLTQDGLLLDDGL